MTWMLWLILVCVVAQSGLTLLLLWFLYDHLTAIQTLQKSLRVWDQPEHLAQPLPEPGTTSLPSDAELAEREHELLAQSQSRLPMPSRRTLRKRKA